MYLARSEFVRIKVKLPQGIRYFWAVKIGQGRYLRADKAGEILQNTTLHLIIADPRDVIWEKPAEINNKYAELEII
jgi:hypothetical protein